MKLTMKIKDTNYIQLARGKDVNFNFEALDETLDDLICWRCPTCGLEFDSPEKLEKHMNQY